MTDLTISLKGLGVFLLKRVGCSVIYVEALIWGAPAHKWRVTASATTVARRATLGRTVPPLLGQRHTLQFRPPHQHQWRDRGNRPQATGKVYAMIGAEAASSGNLVIGHCMIAGKSCCVLYDSGATHSFVSDVCVKRLGLSVCDL